jgi:protein-tyrosine phosphatase
MFAQSIYEPVGNNNIEHFGHFENFQNVENIKDINYQKTTQQIKQVTEFKQKINPTKNNKINQINQINQIDKLIHISELSFFDGSINADYIKRKNIKHVLCCIKNIDTTFHKKFIIDNNLDLNVIFIPYDDTLTQDLFESANICSIQYIKLNIDHNNYNKLSKWLSMCQNKPLIDIAYEFIDNAIRNNEGIIIHCYAGVSRSPAVVIYYLMKKYDLTYLEAYKFVNSKRNIINPNRSFVMQLLKYDNLRGK